ncbi:MAG: PDZ domain-containing protein [Verrucomicrobia bacterium]|nr:PDZ domain-containing protein [Verrucomicrobiota bacterium]
MMHFGRFAAVAACVLVLGMGSGRSAAAESSAASIEKAMRRVYPALVRIHVVGEDAGDGRMNKERSSGSGAIVDKEGHIITNHHVAGKARRLMCRLADGEEIEAELIGTDPLADIAVIRLKMATRRSKTALPVAEFGNSDALRVGDAVLAMGSPGGVAQSVTKGIVSNTALILPGGGGLRLDGEDTGSLVRWIAHDARIFGGNSGGPLVDLAGRIVGINEMGFAGLGGAIPGNLARSVADQIIRNGTVERSWIGIEIQPRPKSLEDDSGALVSGVLPGSPAAEAGLRPGDLLLEYDGIKVCCAIPEDLPVFNAIALSTPLGKRVDLRVRREGAEVRTTLVTRRRDAAKGKDEELRAWGFTARDFTLFSAMENLRDTRNGVLVSSVRSGGPAAQAEPEILPGDAIVEIDGKPVATLADLEALTARLTKDREEPRPTLTAFERGRSRYLTVVRIGTPPQPDKPERSRKPDFPAVLQALPPELAEAMGMKGIPGIRIAYVFPGLAADRAGFRTGDVLVRFDGEPVRAPRPEDVLVFSQQVRQYRIGKTVPVDILRDGKPVTLQFTLAEAADTAEEPERYEDRRLDFAVRSLSLMDRALRKIPDDVQGVHVERVERASTPALADLREGDILLSIDGVRTPDVGATGKALKAVAERKPRFVVLFVRRGIHTRYLELEPDWNGADGTGGPESHSKNNEGKS